MSRPKKTDNDLRAKVASLRSQVCHLQKQLKAVKAARSVEDWTAATEAAGNVPAAMPEPTPEPVTMPAAEPDTTPSAPAPETKKRGLLDGILNW